MRVQCLRRRRRERAPRAGVEAEEALRRRRRRRGARAVQLGDGGDVLCGERVRQSLRERARFQEDIRQIQRRGDAFVRGARLETPRRRRARHGVVVRTHQVARNEFHVRAGAKRLDARLRVPAGKRGRERRERGDARARIVVRFSSDTRHQAGLVRRRRRRRGGGGRNLRRGNSEDGFRLRVCFFQRLAVPVLLLVGRHSAAFARRSEPGEAPGRHLEHVGGRFRAVLARGVPGELRERGGGVHGGGGDGGHLQTRSSSGAEGFVRRRKRDGALGRVQPHVLERAQPRRLANAVRLPHRGRQRRRRAGELRDRRRRGDVGERRRA